MTNLDGIANLDGMANPKIDKKRQKRLKIPKIHASKFQGVFFLRSPKRRRQLGHRHKGLGDAKIDEHSCKSFILVQPMTICHFNADLLKSSNMHTDISHAWTFINVIFY